MNDHAIVIGGSMSGMLTARALTNHFQHVTLLERDIYPESVQFRAGVPQARHIHLVLLRGMALLRQFFPSIDDDLRAVGAVELDLLKDVMMYSKYGWLPRQTSHLVTYMGSRPIFDWVILQRIRTIPSIEIVEQAEAIQLLTNTGAQRVTGVRVRDRSDGSQREYYADLVVDASGRSSRLPRWLEQIGGKAPRETVVNPFLGYGTRLYTLPDDPERDWNSITIGASPPALPRSAVLAKIEGNRWMLTTGGAARDYPPTDHAGFEAYIQRLAHPILADVLTQATPISPIYAYQRTENRMIHLEEGNLLPAGLVAIGDAVCGFNPIYGQGITNTAIAADMLDRYLSANADIGSAMWNRDFQRKLAKHNTFVWGLATGEDLKYPTTEGASPSRSAVFMNWYFERFTSLMTHDAEAVKAFIGLIHLIDSPLNVFSPKFFMRTLRTKPIIPTTMFAPPVIA